MLASGRALEARAGARAQRDLRLLLQRAPQTAHRRCGDELTSPPLDDVGPGDLLVVFPGEVVPCDGRVEASPAVLDESVLTLSLIHISEPTRRTPISYAVFCLKKKKTNNNTPNDEA